MNEGEEKKDNLPVVVTILFPFYSKTMKKPHKCVRIQITIPSK